MAQTTAVKKAWKTLIWLGVIFAVLVGTIAGGVIWSTATWTPKLALDLEGGTQIILTPKLESGQQVSSEQLDQAVSIIRQRVDASGVSEAEVTTQGGQNVVVSIPGSPDEATLNRIESSAKLDFRAVLLADVASTSTTSTPGATPDPSLESTPTASPTNGSDLAWVTPALQAQFDSFDCNSEAAEDAGQAPADQPLITCDDNGVKYLLGPVEIEGADIADASAGVATTQNGASTGQWVVDISFNDAGTKKFADVTTRLYGLTGVQNQFAIVLDGRVITAPTTGGAFTDGKAQISGSFTQDSAQTLADQLKFGALPIGFTTQSSEAISATLGSTQLMSGLIAGAIGLLLVIIYSLIQYRLLGLVTIASLVVAAALTYLLVTLMSWRIDFRLSLAGVAGLIVAIGITADSFIVYFERIRDELRDGRSLNSSVQAGWKRAIRTITASDAVNFLAAGVLYVLAIGNVRGFAFTLGLTTIVDIIVVILFTHPLMTLLAELPFFRDGHKLSGLDPRALGAVYRGRAQFRAPAASVTAAKKGSSSREAARRQTIAERKAAELAASSTKGTSGADSTRPTDEGKNS
ncbi:protein translocase subunit SecD [Herbiconiux sp. KACC 21604]|uniref:protein translocase subunit SecD n=1 Tax=unclassified Herbiconiux TaxID=2618217 RepID=UPI001490A3B9|nr:protein translocase subunit SecD [Herbiconiux sp. SALV-R1]QJU53628.1 protein translocase subunit SecD [Herbiconiux sp. SALV-R1]WPO88612.1 protein translocase subunit SecD [Herbiconiux sp. KACC 21604]